MEQKEIKRAVALTYNPEKDYSPKISAKGSGHLAERIIQIALQSDVPVRENPELLRQLARFDVLDQIPESLYGAVADILTFIYKIDELAGKYKN